MNKKTKTKSLFSANLARLRKEAGLSQKRIAEHTGLTGNYLYDLENAKKCASFDTIDRLSKALEVEPMQFFVDPDHWEKNKDLYFLTTLERINKNINRMFKKKKKKTRK
ncbi:MAG: helix-turn-helix transcriptional regulator [Treponema sp.]|jgi:transcriptional regulator with XRE-family HTH domain|nr:helix-turn-helix transcriptional regulator [Treponema sp.]